MVRSVANLTTAQDTLRANLGRCATLEGTMLPALIVGALTAWYLGLRAGMIAAGVTFGALLVANFVPGMGLVVYGVVLAWCAALYFLGPKMSKQGGGGGLNVAAMTGQAASWLRRHLNRSE